MQYSIWSSRFLCMYSIWRYSTQVVPPAMDVCGTFLLWQVPMLRDAERASDGWQVMFKKIATFGEPGISNLGKGWKMREVEKRFLEGGDGSIQWYNDPKKRSNRRQCDDYQQQRSTFSMMMMMVMMMMMMMMITNIIKIIPIFGAMCRTSRKYFQHAYLAIKFQPGFRVHDHVSQARLVDDALLMVQMRLSGMYKGV